MKRGFTFLEILMVVVILGLFVAMATPRFRSTYVHLQLSSQARGLAKFLTYAQERAVIEGRRYRFQMDPEIRSYWLMAEGEEAKEDPFARAEGRYGRVTQLPEGMGIEGEQETILFYPDGRSESFAFSLKHREGGELILRNGRPFGYVRVEEAQPVP